MSKISEKIIVFLADYPEREFYGQEIADKINCSKASASIILKELSRKKMVSRVARGHMKFYRINAKSLEVKKLKINIVLENINHFIPRLEKVSERVILFGSGSRGEQTAQSDIDLFVVSREKKERRKFLVGITLTIGAN